MSTEWYHQIMGEIFGPVSASELRQKAQSGEITPETWVRKGSDGDWVDAYRLKGLFPEKYIDSSLNPTSVKRDLRTSLPPHNKRVIISAGSNRDVSKRMFVLIGGFASVALIVALIIYFTIFSTPSKTKSKQIMTTSDMSVSAPTQTHWASSIDNPASVNEFANPTQVQFDIQGMRIGDTLTEEFAYSHCPAIDKGKPNIICREWIKINGKEVFVLFYFDNFKLIGVILSFDPDTFDYVIDAYTAKFGVPPHDIKTTPLTTRLGASYMNVTALWETTSGPFIISKYGSSVDKGFGILETPEYIQYRERERLQDTKSLRDKL